VVCVYVVRRVVGKEIAGPESAMANRWKVSEWLPSGMKQFDGMNGGKCDLREK